MRVVILFGAFFLSIFLIKSFYEPTTPAQIKNEYFSKLNRAPLGLVSKKQLTKNVVKEATVWEEVHRVRGGVITFKSIVHEFMPNKFTTMFKVKHQNMKGKTLYTRTAYSQSKHLTIYRYGEDGARNAQTGLVELIKFRKNPSDQCLRNRFKLLKMPKACNATLTVSLMSNTPQLKVTAGGASIYDAKGKIIKNISAKSPDYASVMKKHLKRIYKQAKVATALKEPRI